MSEYPNVSKTGKRYRFDTIDGRDVKVFESGAILDARTSKLIEGPKDYRLTTERAVELNERKQELAIEAARQGLVAGLEASDIVASNPLVAWAHVIAAQTQLAMSPDMGHASTKAAELVGKSTQFLPDRRVVSSSGDPGATGGAALAVVGILAEALRAVLTEKQPDIGHDNMREHEETNVLDGEVIEVDGDE